MDENDDYELKNIEMGRKEEKDISDRLRKMVGKCKRIYSQADKGNASNIVLEEETVHTMIESIAEENVAITCGSHDYNMLNYKQVDDALSLAKTGENTETEFFVINTSGVWIYNKLQFKNKDLYVTSATAAFDDNMSPHIVQIEKIQVYDWNYTDKGWIIWEKALSINQEMDMHVFYRILPLDEQCRELGNKCITPVSYFCNNLFLVDWNQNSLENIEFNDLFEFLYTMKYGEKIDEKKYASGIPKVEFEEVVTTYFDISIETLEIYAQYDDLQPSEHNLFHLYCIICRDGEFCAYNKHKYILALSTTILQVLGWIGNPRPECFYIRSILWVLCPSLSLSWLIFKE